MTKTTLTISEIFSLDAELNGITNRENGQVLFKGLLNHKLSILMKYRLTEFADKLTKIKESATKLQQELYKELGEPVEGKQETYQIKPKIKQKAEGSDEEVEVDNPNFKKLNEEIEALFNEKKEIEHYPFRITEFNLEVEETYPIFLSKIVKEEEK